MNEVPRKLAATILLGFLLSVVFSSVGSDVNLATIYWIIYLVTCGAIINFDDHQRHLELFLLSIPSPLIIICITYYRTIFYGSTDNCYLSGLRCKIDILFIVMSAVFLLASIVSVWLVSYLSPWLGTFLKKLFGMSEVEATRIRERIVWVSTVITAAVGLVIIIAHGWSGL